MSFSGAESIGRTLARLGQMATRSAEDHDGSRGQILLLIQESGEPVSLEDISAATNLHVNTIRTHVEVLRAAGKIDRVRAMTSGRGRPRWLYVAATSDDPYYRMAGELSQALKAADDPGLADEAARRWRAADHVAKQAAADPAEAVDTAANSLVELGFAVEVAPTRDTIYLTACPYASLVDEHPVICEIHARAVEQVLDGTGQDVRLKALDVFPRPGVCVARLNRTDVAPAWTVPGAAPEDGSSRTSRRTR